MAPQEAATCASRPGSPAGSGTGTIVVPAGSSGRAARTARTTASGRGPASRGSSRWASISAAAQRIRARSGWCNGSEAKIARTGPEGRRERTSEAAGRIALNNPRGSPTARTGPARWSAAPSDHGSTLSTTATGAPSSSRSSTSWQPARASGTRSVIGTGQTVPSTSRRRSRTDFTSAAPRKPDKGWKAPSSSSSTATSSSAAGTHTGHSGSVVFTCTPAANSEPLRRAQPSPTEAFDENPDVDFSPCHPHPIAHFPDLPEKSSTARRAPMHRRVEPEAEDPNRPFSEAGPRLGVLRRTQEKWRQRGIIAGIAPRTVEVVVGPHKAFAPPGARTTPLPRNPEAPRRTKPGLRIQPSTLFQSAQI